MNTRWFQVLGARRAPALRLYCFPYAGAGHTVYQHWRELLSDDVELTLVKLPGRGARFNEPPAPSLDALADAIAEEIACAHDKRFALFGHSMGALMAFETARRLATRFGMPPALLAVSGRRAPSAPNPRAPVSALADDHFLAHLRSMQGLPHEVLTSPEWLQFFLPIIRADFALCEAHPVRPAAPLDIPLQVFGGSEDTSVPVADLAGWQSETRGQCRIDVLPGGHFFLFTHEAMLVSQIERTARSLPEAVHAAA